MEDKMLEITSKKEGAELTSIKVDGEEKLHDGKEFWNRQVPILFPIVGKLKDGKTIIENKTYEMGQHGFARDLTFECVKYQEAIQEYKLMSNEETLKKYPYQFVLTVRYQTKPKDNTVIVSYEVENIDSRNILFGIGGHPAFKCDYSSGGYEIEFEKQEDEIGILELEDGLITRARLKEEIIKDNKISLTENSFDRDAIIMQNVKSNKITLKENGNPILDFDFTGFPYLAIWSKKGAPFVCIEPWYNTADYKDTIGIFEEKTKIIKLGIKEKFKCKYKIKFY